MNNINLIGKGSYFHVYNHINNNSKIDELTIINNDKYLKTANKFNDSINDNIYDDEKVKVDEYVKNDEDVKVNDNEKCELVRKTSNNNINGLCEDSIRELCCLNLLKTQI